MGHEDQEDHAVLVDHVAPVVRVVQDVHGAEVGHGDGQVVLGAPVPLSEAGVHACPCSSSRPGC